MFWNKKEQGSRLPDLPPVRSSPPVFRDQIPMPMEEEYEDKHTLPSFPDSAMQRGFSQSAIKDAVTTEDQHIDYSEQLPQPSPIPANSKSFKIMEMEDSDTSIPQLPVAKPSSTSKIREDEDEDISGNKKEDNLFIRIDKFRSARRTIRTTQEKLDEMELILKKIRETKMREEQELEQWEREMMTLKSRIKDLTENIFEKIE